VPSYLAIDDIRPDLLQADLVIDAYLKTASRIHAGLLQHDGPEYLLAIPDDLATETIHIGCKLNPPISFFAYVICQHFASPLARKVRWTGLQRVHVQNCSVMRQCDVHGRILGSAVIRFHSCSPVF
jgi:hypothetical protein